MTVDDARDVLFRSAKLRFPTLKGLPTGEKVDALEDYLAATAIARGELEEARLHVYEALGMLLDEWDDIEGWEPLIRASRPTQEDVRRAKKTLRPDLAAGINSGKRIVARLSDQIARLEHDDKAASREYTIITGGA